MNQRCLRKMISSRMQLYIQGLVVVIRLMFIGISVNGLSADPVGVLYIGLTSLIRRKVRDMTNDGET